MDHEDTLAQSEVKSVLTRERYYRDSNQWDKLRDVYHPDNIKTWIDISWYQGHVDGFIDGSKKQASGGLVVTHSINPVEVLIRGSKALAVSVTNIIARFEIGGAEYDLTSWVRLVSKLEKVEMPVGAACWKLISLDCIYIRDGIQPVIPLSGPIALNFTTVKDARKSYRYLSWHIATLGLKVRDDLPGVDNEQSVINVMDKGYKWLESV